MARTAAGWRSEGQGRLAGTSPTVDNSLKTLGRVLGHFGVLGQRRDDLYPEVGDCWNDEEVLRSSVALLFEFLSPELFGAVRSRDYARQCDLVGANHSIEPIFADLVVACATAYLESLTGQRRKWGLSAALRKKASLIRALQAQANGRCALCGWPFSAGFTAELDHILPWRFVRDPAGGANWRLLCGLCNRAKSDHFSAAMTQAWQGWPAREREALFTEGWPQRQTAYAILSRDRVCARCGGSPATHRLAVRLKNGERDRGLVLSNFEVVCESHGEAELFAVRAEAQSHPDDPDDEDEAPELAASPVV